MALFKTFNNKERTILYRKFPFLSHASDLLCALCCAEADEKVRVVGSNNVPVCGAQMGNVIAPVAAAGSTKVSRIRAAYGIHNNTEWISSSPVVITEFGHIAV